jgi:trimeric autotransporter adhesin
MTVVLYILLLLAEHQGQVIFGGVPVPGATVTATQNGKQFVAVTNEQGAYSFPELAEGPFTVQVEMLGFSTVKQEVNAPTAQFELKMLPVEEIHAEVVHAAPVEPAPAPAATTAAASNTRPPANQRQNQARQQTGFQRTEVNASSSTNAAAPANDSAPQSGAFANLSQDDLNQRAADGLLINGTVNNGAASPFAQLARIGNNLRGRPLYNGGASIIVDNSALDARPYSLAGLDTPKQSYNRLTGAFNIGGPLRIPHLIRNNAPTFFFSYQRLQNRTANTASGRMPTLAERSAVAENLISPQAKTLLDLFPLPNFNDNPRYNYQVPIVDSSHQDGIQGRLNKALNQRNQFAGNIDIQSTRADNSNLFRFVDTTRALAINGAFQWTTRPTQRFSATFRYQFNRQTNRLTPYFANRVNVSGIAGITGNNQEAPNWGPPTLNFASGISTLSDAQYSNNRTQNSTFVYSSFWNHGRHNVEFGADMRRYQLNVLSQQDPRGTFTFTGQAAGSDFVGFLLGIPDASSIAFGNADKYFRQKFVNAFFRDDWRVNGALTLNLGVRWEYETPSSELRGRLVNLNIAPDFSSVEAVHRNGLIHGDALAVQPRISFAWRPIAASSLIVRGGYGIYRNTNVYQAIATAMSQQWPLSKSLSVDNRDRRLTLANGFGGVPETTTFAVDPNFRVGYVQTWQLSVQRDLPAALQMTAMYLGTKGTRLPQEVLPNTFPPNTFLSEPAGPSGYAYLSSNGNSIRHAGQFQLRRRLRNGFTATTQYTYARAFDNAPLMAGGIVTANRGGTAIAQNWLDLRAERAPSSFDQRHQLSVQTQYTTGVGVRGGALLGGWKGALFKEWTLAGQLNLGSGLPQTPTYLATVRGIGVTGNLRPDLTGAPIGAAPVGFFLNPAAFRIPPEGQWGTAGRNSITGPSQFSLNASLGRSFPWRDRYNIDVRLDATNVLNHVTFKNWNTQITSAQFGLPASADAMRSIQTTVRLRF